MRRLLLLLAAGCWMVDAPVWAEAMRTVVDVDLGLQARAYSEEGLDGQSRLQPSLSARLELYRSWDNGQQSVTFTPFARVDGEDDERTHFDIRELFWSRVWDDWEVHLGAKQVFWGVTEFKHLVDVVNQTDLVENIDGEDKLGQPMVHASWTRRWGIIDAYVLTGFRERTFPGPNGRLRGFIPVDGDKATYESGAGRRRIDGAVRWSHRIGALEFGLHHFSGTSRDPVLVPSVSTDDLVLRPHYPLIDQTGADAQVIVGDWAWKLEAISNKGYADRRYNAFNVGFERTLVGIGGSRADAGLIAEYLYDDRGENATNTLFENDLALGMRWSANDVADTHALVGVIQDVKSDQVVVTLEGSRRLGETWVLYVEGRVFAGADEIPDPGLVPAAETRAGKLWPLRRDDYLQIELTRYF